MASGDQNNSPPICVQRLPQGPTVEAAMLALCNRPGAFLLESAAPQRYASRFSILGCDPVEVFEADQDGGPQWLDRLAARVGPADARFRNMWDRVVDRSPRRLPFVGGWVGFVAYEAGPLLESVACTKPHDIRLPMVRFALYDTVALFDHHDQAWFLVAVDLPRAMPNRSAGMRNRPPAAERLARLQATLLDAPPAPPIDWTRSVAAEPIAVMDRDDYFERVRSAKRYLTAGDIYQVNLTQRFTTRTDASAIDIYRRLRIANPAAYSALLDYGDSAILSSSPELFLEVRDGRIVTRPIKGTRPRTDDAGLNAVHRRELLESPKDRAELTMIVDLLRNDLGRVSRFGSVQVVSPGELEAHPTVYHRVATIRSRLRAGSGWADVLRATFPGGSITGCPKIRAMQIVDELETTERSVYCGSIGYIGLDGSMCLNIAIRTMVLERGRLHLFGGGAIVADSEPEDEYDEILAKTAGMMRALRAADPAGGTGLQPHRCIATGAMPKRSAGMQDVYVLPASDFGGSAGHMPAPAPAGLGMPPERERSA